MGGSLSRQTPALRARNPSALDLAYYPTLIPLFQLRRMAPRKGKGIISSGATSKKASPLPPKTTEPAVPLTPEELIQRELKRPGFKVCPASAPFVAP